MPGIGSFRCRHCGHTLTVNPPVSEVPRQCPNCSSNELVRASLMAGARFLRGQPAGDPDAADDRVAWLQEARSYVDTPGEYLAYHEDGAVQLVGLTREWTRVGRSLAADVRFDDPTVSRRHALIVRQPDGVRVLDDRSLNGVFVNGERVEWRVLSDGDEIVVGRHRLTYLSDSTQTPAAAPADTLQTPV
jgi:putative FmdB family regulatory protein